MLVTRIFSIFHSISYPTIDNPIIGALSLLFSLQLFYNLWKIYRGYLFCLVTDRNLFH